MSLYARIFHCLEIVSGCDSIEQYASEVTFAELQEHTTTIFDRFANRATVVKLRYARAYELRKSVDKTAAPTQGDMVHENTVLFLYDALLLREFNDAIKDGDSGRVFTVIKQLALLYRGSGRTKYGYECFLVIHNLMHVWYKQLQ